MHRSTGLTRILWRVAALLQHVVPSVESIADARLERDAVSARAYSHVEATTGTDCVRAHPSDCALCQHLTTPLSKAAKPAPPLCAARAEMPAVAFSGTRTDPHAERPTLPRAPPAF
jgi:hypothetical protein